MASRTNTYAIRFAKGDEHKKTPNYPDFLRSLEGEKKVMGLYNAFQDSSFLKKLKMILMLPLAKDIEYFIHG